MRKLVLSTLFLMIISLAFADVSGNVSGHWTTADSPVNVTGDIVLQSGSSLIIDPGVQVVFAGHYKFEVRGYLDAIGNNGNHILFTPVNHQTGWAGIKFIHLNGNGQPITRVYYCDFEYGIANTSESSGGAINLYYSDVHFDHVTVSNNQALGYGGGIYMEESSPLLHYVEVLNNTATFDGGGIYCGYYSHPDFYRVAIAHNSTQWYGGGIAFFNNCDVTLTNVTISDNQAGQEEGQGISIISQTDITISNSIFWNQGYYEIYWENQSSVNATYSDIQNGTDLSYFGVGCIDEDPKLAISDASTDLGLYNYHLLETSPCIDAGAFDMTDPDGTRIDMGCYASTTDIKKTKVDHYNWVSFPRLDRNDNDYVIAPPVLENYINWPFDLDLYYNTENYEYSQLNYSISTHTWTPGYYEIKSSYGYKLNPELTSYLPLDGSRLPADYELTYSIQPNQYEWLGYWIAKSQNIVDAFGDLWQNVEKVKAEDWYYDRLSIIKGDDVPATASFSTKNKTMEYGKGYMIWFKDNSVSNFHWTDSGQFTKPVKKEQPENFTYTDKPDYEVIDVVSIPADIREIGVFKNNECVGAVVVKDSCEQILVYSDDANRDQVPFSFEIVTEGSKTSSIKDYEVFNPKTGKFEDNTLVTGGQEHSIIKFIDLGNGEIVPENTKVELYENYPNPFNPTTTISFSLPKEGDIKLDIYNMKGQVVKTLYSGIAEKGKHSIMWNGKNSNNKTVTSGLYFYKLRTSGKTITKKMLMLK